MQPCPGEQSAPHSLVLTVRTSHDKSCQEKTSTSGASKFFAFQPTLGSASLRTWLSVFELFSPCSIARQFSICTLAEKGRWQNNKHYCWQMCCGTSLREKGSIDAVAVWGSSPKLLRSVCQSLATVANGSADFEVANGDLPGSGIH
jgi:hypothetical protein